MNALVIQRVNGLEANQLNQSNRFENVNIVFLQKHAVKNVIESEHKDDFFPSVSYLFSDKSAVNRFRGMSSVTTICLHFTGVKAKEKERSLVTEECCRCN